MTRWDADTWADDSRLIRKDTEILTKESEMRDKQRKGRSQRAAGGTLKGKAYVKKLIALEAAGLLKREKW